MLKCITMHAVRTATALAPFLAAIDATGDDTIVRMLCYLLGLLLGPGSVGTPVRLPGSGTESAELAVEVAFVGLALVWAS